MKIVAKQGDGRYLVDIEEASKEELPLHHGRVIDVEQGLFYPPLLIGSITARGYWVPFTGTASFLASLLEQVSERPSK